MIKVKTAPLLGNYLSRLHGLEDIIVELWKISKRTKNTEQKLAALRLAKEYHQSMVDICRGNFETPSPGEEQDEDEDKEDEYKGTTRTVDDIQIFTPSEYKI